MCPGLGIAALGRFFWLQTQIGHQVAQIDSLGGLILGCFFLGNIFCLIYLNFPLDFPIFQIYTLSRKKQPGAQNLKFPGPFDTN